MPRARALPFDDSTGSSRAVITTGELAVAGADETGRLAAELDRLQAAFRELGPGA